METESTAPYSLSELLELVSDTLQETLYPSYWVIAEIASLSVRDGHAYLELVEKKAANTMPIAKTRAVCWRNQYGMLSAYFEKETGEHLRTGLQVMIAVAVEMHPLYGFSLNIVDINPTYTKGDLAKQREQTISRLHAEGIFDMNRMQALPTLPKRIAVISSADAAGYGDFCHQLQQSQFGAAFSVELFPALVQGDRAANSILDALSALFAHLNDFDLVVIIRGGGSQMDLACFDDYELAAHCAQFPLPVVTGIGHQKDVSILDMVAHTSLKTPTAVAEWLIAKFQTQQQHLTDAADSLQRIVAQLILRNKHLLDNSQLQLQLTFANRIQMQRSALSFALQKLDILSPETIFRKGYSLSRINGRLVSHLTEAEIKKDDLVETITLNTHFWSKITKKTDF